MPSPPSDTTKFLFKLLSEGGEGHWHDYHAIKDALAAKVAPGPALRKYQNDIESRRRARNDPSYDVPHNDDMRIEFGRRRVAQSTMSAWLKDEKRQGIEVRGSGSDKQIRIRPGFIPPWGVREMEPSAEAEPDAAPQDPPFQGQGYTEVPAEGFRSPEDDTAASDEASAPESVAVDPERARAFVCQDGKWIPADRLPPAAATGHAETVAMVQAAEDGFDWSPEDEEPQGAVIEIPVFELGPRVAPVGDSPSSYDWPPLTPQPDPECPECGLAVRNQGVHTTWHEGFVKRQEQENGALLRESQVVGLCRDVMGQELDRFQHGMQLWLEKQFAQLEASMLALRSQGGPWKGNDAWRAQ